MATRMRFGIFILLSCLITSISVFGQERYFQPVDEAGKNASFLQFRNRLIDAVKRKDASFIYSIVAPRIQNSFGGNNGAANFKKIWKLQNPKSEFWEEFAFVINRGGKFEEGMFVAPDIFAAFPADLDSFEYSVIAGTDVKLRSAPGQNSEVKDTLSYNFVKVDYEKSSKAQGNAAKPSWLWVETLGGKTGFVSSRFVRSPIDYRAGFEKKAGKWQMIFFIAGD